MLIDEFKGLKHTVSQLSPKQKIELIQYLNNPDEMPSVTSAMEQEKPFCPRCRSIEAYRWGTTSSRQRYRCKTCNKTYTSLSGSPINRIRMTDKLDKYAETMTQSLTLRKAALACGISLRTAFQWRHKLLALADMLNDSELSGIVEMDETFIRESEKGSKTLNRDPHKRGSGRAKGTKYVKVVVARDRHAHVADIAMKNFTLKKLKEHILPRLKGELVLCTDGHLNYELLAKQNEIKHQVLNASEGERIKDKVFHIQGVNGYHSRLKHWLSRFHGVASKYLHKYLGWFRWFEKTTIEQQSCENLMRKFVLETKFQHLNAT